MDKQQAPPQWTITTQQEQLKPDASGRYAQGVTVGFTTLEGLQGTVFVPDSQYNPQNVRTMVQQKVDQMRAVQTLQG